jgi:DNA-binding winged helix-turn-helix (wHTH) protein
MPPTLPLVRFANFEVDLRAGELRKDGSKVRLQEQPFQLLTALLESAGEAVTREELRRRLWSEDTLVDFDHRLAVAVSKLRDALQDSAEEPKFVETVGRRGYRFVGQLESSDCVYICGFKGGNGRSAFLAINRARRTRKGSASGKDTITNQQANPVLLRCVRDSSQRDRSAEVCPSSIRERAVSHSSKLGDPSTAQFWPRCE